MKRILIVMLSLLLSSGSLWAEEERDKTIGRTRDAGTILEEIMSAPDSGIPEEILNSAKCIAIVPSLLKAGFGIGGAYGKGVASCRLEKGDWSAPALFTVKGGSFGLQIGGQAVDMVMVVVNENGMKQLLSSKFKLGLDASVAAGPVGRHADASTDWKMRAEVLTYSRARGVFAGLSVNGAAITQGKDETRAFYGRMVPFRTILNGNVAPPTESTPFLAALKKYAGSAPLNPATPTPAATAPAPTGR